ncbi:MAG: hypothetical protein ACP5FH_05630 [Terracidiphilus sp.]
MAKITLIFAAILIVFGMVAFFLTGVSQKAAFLPAEFGMLLAFCGAVAVSPNETRRKMFMHINVTIGVVGCAGGAIQAVRLYHHAASIGTAPDRMVMVSLLGMSGLLLIYVLLCVRSFIAARRGGKI